MREVFVSVGRCVRACSSLLFKARLLFLMEAMQTLITGENNDMTAQEIAAKWKN